MDAPIDRITELLLYFYLRYDHPNPGSLFTEIHPCTYTFDRLFHPPLSPTSSAPLHHPDTSSPHFRSQDLRRRASRRITRTVVLPPSHSRCPITHNSHSYATAKDEFDIASEETDKKTVYAADDRAAAQEELAKFKDAYQKAINSTDGEQIKNRIGSRVRELERAVEAMEEKAVED